MSAQTQRWAAAHPDSDIFGSGFGASHCWRRHETTAGRATRYVCRDCGAAFYHHYPSTPNIFQAMAESRNPVPDQCPSAKATKRH